MVSACVQVTRVWFKLDPLQNWGGEVTRYVRNILVRSTLFYRNAYFNTTNFKENGKRAKFLESANCKISSCL